MKKYIIFLSLIVLTCSCVKTEKSIRLQYKYKNGDMLKYKLSAISQGTITLSPEGTSSLSSIKMETKIEALTTQKVIEVDQGGAAKIEINYDAFNQKIKIGDDKSFPFIAEEKGRNPFLNFLQEKKINVIIGRDGSLLGITGIEEIFNYLLAQMPQQSSLPNEFIYRFKEDFEKKMMSVVEENYHRFPLEDMKVGDSWVQARGYNILSFEIIPVYGKFTYTLEEFKEIRGVECVQIGINAIMNFSEDITKPLVYNSNMPPLEVKFKGNAEGKGTMLFAYQEGKLISSNLVITTNPEIIHGEEIPFNIKMNLDTHILIELQ